MNIKGETVKSLPFLFHNAQNLTNFIAECCKSQF